MGMGRVLASATLFVAGGASAIGHSESRSVVALPVAQAHDNAAFMNASWPWTEEEHFATAIPAAWSHGRSRPSTDSFAERSAHRGKSHGGVSRLADLPGTVVPDVSPAASAIPEPHIYGLLLAGLGVIGFVARRRAHGV